MSVLNQWQKTSAVVLSLYSMEKYCVESQDHNTVMRVQDALLRETGNSLGYSFDLRSFNGVFDSDLERDLQRMDFNCQLRSIETPLGIKYRTTSLGVGEVIGWWEPMYQIPGFQTPPAFVKFARDAVRRADVSIRKPLIPFLSR